MNDRRSLWSAEGSRHGCSSSAGQARPCRRSVRTSGRSRWQLGTIRAGRRVAGGRCPAILGFPAPWRDLFRKSGRPLEAELARSGYALAPADSAQLIFVDGATLALPTIVVAAYDVEPGVRPCGAGRWQALLDQLDDVQQALRRLGWNPNCQHVPISAGSSADADGPSTVADLAADVAHPHLRAGPEHRLRLRRRPRTHQRWWRSSLRSAVPSAAGRYSP